jgi:murein DD-endopeptidase MepM/ murein hydrolase activator NlpD
MTADGAARLESYRARDASGLDPHPLGEQVRRYLRASRPAPLLGEAWSRLRTFPVDLSPASRTVPSAEAAAPPERFDVLIRSVVGGDPSAVGIGGYGERRGIYTGPEYESSGGAAGERRSVHLAVDVWAAADTPVCAPLEGRVAIVRNNDTRLDYGPVVVLEHATDDGVPFFSLYGHLSMSTLGHRSAGEMVSAGDVIGWVGTPPTNGDWAPHVHVQVILDLLDLAHDYPGVALPSQRSLWLGLSPDPALLLHLDG